MPTTTITADHGATAEVEIPTDLDGRVLRRWLGAAKYALGAFCPGRLRGDLTRADWRAMSLDDRLAHLAEVLVADEQRQAQADAARPAAQEAATRAEREAARAAHLASLEDFRPGQAVAPCANGCGRFVPAHALRLSRRRCPECSHRRPRPNTADALDL